VGYKNQNKGDPMTRDTVGKISLELSQKAPETSSPVELEKEMQQDYMKNLIETVEKATKTWAHDFYVVVTTKNEKLMPNVFRNYFHARQSCPTPEYDQSVFKYHYADEKLEYLWTVPSKDSVIHLKQNAHLVVKEEQQLRDFALAFVDGSLFMLAKKLNGEELFSSKIIH
jgi:hypothetical protein